MRVADLTDFEEQMKLARGIKRGGLCKMLGISQAKWRRHIEDRPADEAVTDRTLGLAMAAVWAGLEPFDQVRFTLLDRREIPASGPTKARTAHEVRFMTWPEGL